jgi:hypothetical protein
MGDHFLFGSVFIKKITKPNFFLKKTRTELKPVWLGFFPVWLGFFLFGFGFFGFRLIKPNRTGRFFQNFNRFFFKVRFFWLFFSRFSWFFGFFAHPYNRLIREFILTLIFLCKAIHPKNLIFLF